MNGQKIGADELQQILELAHWAPTHGRTEPWHFFVYEGAALKQFGQTHATLYWENTAEEKRNEASRDKLIDAIEKASQLLIAVMKRGSNPKIPAIEEVAASCAAIQNILLGATALGIASFWNSGGMTHHPALKEHLGLAADDVVLGLIYLGYSDEAKEGKRNTAIGDKVTMMR
jgi:nitroreductase